VTPDSNGKPIWIHGNSVLWGYPVPRSYSKPLRKVGQIFLLKLMIIEIGSGLSDGGI